MLESAVWLAKARELTALADTERDPVMARILRDVAAETADTAVETIPRSGKAHSG